MSRTDTDRIKDMIQLLDAAVSNDCVHKRCDCVKNALHDIVASGEEFLSAEWMAPHPERYARRLLHRDPEGRYSVVIMVWGPGQGTAVHDHAGQWCVECVYRGRIKVTSYDLIGQPEGDTYRFKEEMTQYASVADAGALIPPFEYHTIQNSEETPSVTIHVYGEELKWCHIFVPEADGTFRRELRELCYTA